MSNEKSEAICPVSVTERHFYLVKYDTYGNAIEEPRGIHCEACDRPIRQDGARWVTFPTVQLAPWLLAGPLTIREEESVEDVL